jgi:predicted ester cyclase
MLTTHRYVTDIAVTGLALAATAGMGLLRSTVTSAADDHASAAARNAEIVRRYFEEVWNQGRLDVLDELLDPAYVNHTPSTPNPPPGPAGLKPIVAAIRLGFPDLHFRIEDVVATPTHAVARTLMTGTHRGDLLGLKPTGRQIAVNQINIERVTGGRIIEHWRVTDELTLMRQLGVVG